MIEIKKNDIAMIGLIVVVILLFRILYIDIFQSLIVTYDFDLSHLFESFVSNIVVLLLSILLDILGVWKLSKYRPYGQNSLTRFLLDITLIFFISAFGAFVLIFADFTSNTFEHRWLYFLFSILSIFLFNAFLVSILDILFYALYVRDTMQKERLQKRQAEYQYHKLKEQMNPHFLFNSLNMLDYLVQSHEDERASLYIKKLASIYRYLLQTNDLELVTIEEELGFVWHYVDLLKVRFSEGLILNVDIDEEYRSRMVIPCGLQILVENAIKHNVVNKSEPLTVDIKVLDGKLVVVNNIQLRLNVNESMNVGLNNICSQYRDVTGQNVEINMTDEIFEVKLPIV